MSSYLTRLLARGQPAVGALHAATRSRFGPPQAGPAWPVRADLAARPELEDAGAVVPPGEARQGNRPSREDATPWSPPAPLHPGSNVHGMPGAPDDAPAAHPDAVAPLHAADVRAGRGASDPVEEVDGAKMGKSRTAPSSAAAGDWRPATPAGGASAPGRGALDPPEAEHFQAQQRTPLSAEPSLVLRQREPMARAEASASSRSGEDGNRLQADSSAVAHSAVAAHRALDPTGIATGALARSRTSEDDAAKATLPTAGSNLAVASAYGSTATAGPAASATAQAQAQESRSRGEPGHAGAFSAKLSVPSTRAEDALATRLSVGAAASSPAWAEPARGGRHSAVGALAPPRRNEAPATVQVHIGTLEIRATVSAPSASTRPAEHARPAPRMTLDDYLRQRSAETKP